MSPRNWFDQGGQAYARFRPEYPSELAAYLGRIAPSRELAVDVGCGNGQLTTQLAAHFDAVLGIDPSADQIANAVPQEGVRYVLGPAEHLPVGDRGASLVCAAQAAHWFDLPAFYAEARRVAASGAVLALISYGVLALDDALSERFDRFYWQQIGPYWPPERKLVDNGYADLPFPFDERAAPPMAIGKDWTLREFLGYVSTWSAVRGVREAGREDLLTAFAEDLTTLWGDPAATRRITWPINMRVGSL
ncbi:SAM-dependent methyltransferase [Roseateles aquatilis]|uniref:SAM-dependent methyltransferase n=2 Tax=Roseateles aquatilis TaxID=431061 RepID=A0A246J3K8_9BURK|nr:SAM-dependent methyltransferase [Roseateles aquatilis]